MAKDDDDDLFDSVNAMADRLGLSGKERTSYVHESMTRGGYRAVPQYVKSDDDEDDEDDSPFFGRSGRKRRSDAGRSSSGGSRRRRRDEDDDDW